MERHRDNPVHCQRDVHNISWMILGVPDKSRMTRVSSTTAMGVDKGRREGERRGEVGE
jgi:hypothetical protein